jgi:hypothetical protein
MKECDNLLINQYQNQGKVFTRPGSELYDKTAARPVANRISTCFQYKGKLYVQSADRLYYYKNSVDKWTEILGPDGHKAFPGSTASHQFTYDHWNGHTIMANSTLPGYPMKFYMYDGFPTLFQAGLPKYDSDSNDLDSEKVVKTYSDTIVNAGSFIVGKKYVITEIGSTNFTLIGASSNSVGLQFTATGVGSGTGKAKRIWDTAYLYKLVFKRNYYAGSVEIQFLDVGTPSLPIEVLGAYEIGLVNNTLLLYPSLGSRPAIGDPEKTYYVGAENSYYRWNTPTSSYVQLTTEEELFSRIRNKIDLSAIKTLVNTADTNWLTSIDLKIDIYRTLNNGTSYFLAGTINNGVTTFSDYAPDTTFPIKTYANKAAFPAQGEFNNLYYDASTERYYIWYQDTNSNYAYIPWLNDSLDVAEQLYTNGGVVANDPPPRCRSIHVRSDIAYYGGTISEPYRMYQSIISDFDSVPETFYVDVDDEIVAISSTKNNVIILCKENVYRVDGVFDDLGRGGMIVERISDTAGCIGVNTPVQALDGVLWLGKDAVYFTDGFKVMKLNQDYDKTYKTFADNDSNNVKYQGKYDNKKNRVWWTIQEDGASDLNKCYVLDLNWGIRADATFTTISGPSFKPAAIEFINGDMIRCDVNGYVLIHKDTLFVDPKINNSEADVTKWLDEVIVYKMETSSYNFGTSAVRKYVTQANVTCESTTNLALQIVSNNDDNRIVSNLLPIRYRGNIVWGEPDVYWGDITLEWNRQGLIHEKRLMPAKNLRCNYKALKFTNAHVAILSSDTTASAIINPSLKTATLLTNSIIVNAGNFIVNVNYTITEIGTTDFTLIGASSNTVGLVFTATGSGSGTGKAKQIFEYEWPDKSIGYFISFAEDGYVKEYEIVNKGTDVIIFSDVLNAVGSGTQKWVIRGRPLGEVLNLLNVSVIYDVAGPSQTAFKVSTSGEVQ